MAGLTEKILFDEPRIDLAGHKVQVLEDILGQGNRGRNPLDGELIEAALHA